MLATPITARFTRSLDPTTVTSTTFQLRSGASVVSANLSYDTGTRTVTLTPASPLASLADYSVTVLGGPGGVRDAGGEELAATVIWSFQTGSDAGVARLSYGFGEGAGTTVDDASGNGNTGTLMNGPVWTTEGKYGRALAFDGVNDTIRVPDADTQDLTTAMTLEAWIYPTTVSSIAKIIHKQHYVPDHSYWLGLASGAPYARIRTTAGTYSLVAPTELPLAEWTHLAATYDGTAVRVFVNGLEAASRTAAGDVLVSHKPLWVGSAFNAEWFQGRIDDVRLYARALTPAEIVDDMNTSVEDITGPAVTATSPLADAVDIPVGTHVTATFSEPLAASSVSASTFELRDALGALVSAAVTYDAPSRTAVLDPASDLDAGSVYTATLRGGAIAPRITDLAGNPLATGFSWSFTTSTAAGAPTLVAVSLFPRAMSLSVGGSHQFAATAHYSDGTTADVSNTATWDSTATGVLSVNASGRATAEGPGDSVLAATYQGQTGETPVTVYEGEAIPPDPRDVAPPLDRTTTTPLFRTSAFLYTGENSIQRGVAPGTMEARRASVIRGRVTDRDGQALSGVRVTIVGHPELGHTLTRLDGGYEMAVNGGGVLTVEYTRPGLLPARRPAQTAWQDYSHVPDVVMIGLDPSVTPIDLASATSIQVARGSVVTDADGARQATLLVTPGTTATLVRPDGTEQPAPALSLRATEYSVGQNGERAMPAPLPPTSGYTYAVEYSADEALAAGARDVRFNQPVITYTTNFIGFPAGEVVPVGHFDRGLNAWVASDNGRVIRIVGETGGRADLDVDGSGAPSAQGALDELEITDAEREALAALYDPGDSLWRVPITHFSAYDYNWPIHPDDGANPPNLRGGRPRNEAEPDCEAGSIIDCQNQTLGEEIPVVGAPFALHYRSSRAPGRRSAFTLEGPLTNATIPPPLKRVDLEIYVAGRKFSETYPPQANQSYVFTWDGRDAYDRRVQGSVKATVVVYYVYDGTYGRPRSERRSFALTGTQGIVVNEARSEISMSQTFQTYLGLWDMVAGPAGGWSVGGQHFYDGIEEVLYLGNGQRRSIDAEIRSFGVRTAAGSNDVTIGAPTEGVPATSVFLNIGEEVAAGPDGSLYFSETVFPASFVRRVRPDGLLETVAQIPGELGAIGPDGSLYVYDDIGHVVRKRAPDGTVSIIAGTLNEAGYSGDGDPATEARLNGPCGVAVSPDGALYIAEYQNDVIRRVDAGGTISTFAGTGEEGIGPYGGAATDARFTQACGLAVGPDGSIYVADADAARVLRITPDGIIKEFAGNGSFGTTGDGGLATTASIDGPWKVSVSPAGTVYIAVFAGGIRRVDTEGIITTLAGAEGQAVPGDTGPAASTPLRSHGIAVSPDGGIYTTTHTSMGPFSAALARQLRRIAPVLPGLTGEPMAVASEDGAEVYVFDETGRHLRTLNALTGAISLAFEYDGLGRLSEIHDGDGNVTSFERTNGILSRIVAPGGVATSVGVTPLGLLSHVTDPAGNRWDMTYAANGLLLTFQDPNRETSTFTYAADGRLVTDSNAAGGGVTIEVDEQPDATVTTLTTAMSRQTHYLVDQVPEGQRRRNTDWAGLVDETLRGWGFTDTHITPDGTVVQTTRDADPRWQMDAPLTSIELTTQGGLVSTMSTEREVQLSNSEDPLSLTFQLDRVTINGRTHEREYDPATRTLYSRTAQGRTATTQLDAQGRVVEWAPASLTPVQFTYSTTGLLTAITQGARQSTITYDAQRRPATLTDAVGRQVSFTYDPAGRVVTQTLPDTRVIAFAYDANGNVTSLTPPGRPAHTFTYTPMDLAASYAPPAVPGTGATGYTYNLDNQLTAIQRPDGQTTAFGYNAGGQLTGVTFSRGTLGYAYDPAGRLQMLTDPGGVGLTYTYDASLPLTEQWTGPVSGTVTRTFTADFQVGTEQVASSPAVAFTYDADGLVTQAGALHVQRDASTGLVTGTTLDQTTESVEHSAFGELGRQTALVSGTPVFDVQYARDGLGRITQRIEQVDGVTRVFEYAYDPAGRLQVVRRNGAVIAVYTYDSNGNRVQEDGEAVSAAATYDDQDRLLTYGSASYTYTANGELATRTEGGQTTSYTYDTLGNLTRVERPDGLVVTYQVDGRGRRVAKLVNEVVTRRWLYADQLRPIAEVDAGGAVVARFVYGARPNVPEYIVREGATYRVFADHLGSPRVIVNAATGEVVQRLDFDAFGRVVQDSNPGWQPFGFAGGLYDPETGLVRFGARDYDGAVGRWTVKEPIGPSAASTMYTYGESDPINWLDPDGLLAFPVMAAGGGIGAAFGAAGQAASNYFEGRPLSEGVGMAAAKGAIAGALGSGASAIGGSVAKALGQSASGILAKTASAVVSAASSAYAELAVSMCSAQASNAALWGAVSSFATSWMKQPGLSTLAQAATNFAPQSFKSLLSNSGQAIMGAMAASSAVGLASIFGGPF